MKLPRLFFLGAEEAEAEEEVEEEDKAGLWWCVPWFLLLPGPNIGKGDVVGADGIVSGTGGGGCFVSLLCVHFYTIEG